MLCLFLINLLSHLHQLHRAFAVRDQGIKPSLLTLRLRLHALRRWLFYRMMTRLIISGCCHHRCYNEKNNTVILTSHHRLFIMWPRLKTKKIWLKYCEWPQRWSRMWHLLCTKREKKSYSWHNLLNLKLLCK